MTLIRTAAGLASVCILLAMSCGGSAPLSPVPSANGIPTKSAGCVTNSECKGGRICDRGVCQSPALPPQVQQKLMAGDLSIGIVRAVVASNSCGTPPGLRRKLAELKDPRARAAWSKELAGGGPDAEANAAYGTWLVLVERFVRKCSMKVSRDSLASLNEDTHAVLPESEVEFAATNYDCGTLAAVHLMELWPYESRFLTEINKRNFSAAEITRRLWRDTLRDFKAQCSKRLSRREIVRVDASLEKLERIVGLDDETLIGLRTRLLEALEKNDAAAVSEYAQAVSNREKVLDERNAAAYEMRMKNLEAELAKVAVAQKSDAAAKVAAKSASGEQTSAEETLNTIDHGVSTANNALQTVSLARKVFGF